MPSLEFDLSEVLALADDVEAMGDKAAEQGRAVTQATGLALRTSMRADMAASAHFGQAASKITTDTKHGASGTEVEVGPIKGGAGSIANIAYFGGANGGGGTVRDPQENLDEVGPAFEAGLSAIIGDLL